MILLTTEIPNPLRGEIWLVDLEPTKGEEMQKARPAVIVSSDNIGGLNVKLAAPIRAWKNMFENKYYMIKVNPDENNGLEKTSAVDTLQLRSLDIERRFIKKIGRLTASQMEEITTGIVAVIEYQ